MNFATDPEYTLDTSAATWRTGRNMCRLWLWSIRSIMRKHDVIHKTGIT